MNKIILALGIMLAWTADLFSQTPEFYPLQNLHSSISETSGLINFQGRIITHNDSGKEPVLYEIDTLTGNIQRQVRVLNIRNNDWEDLGQDDQYIYIGDFGNNYGDRMNLRIYRILKSEYLNTSTGNVSADSIVFAYADQQDFNPALYQTNYDAEAFILMNDSIYIFTKNWVNAKTYIYSLSKTPGTYLSSRIDSLDVGGFVTGAVYEAATDQVILTGYSFSNSFVWSCRLAGAQDISGNVLQKYTLGGAGIQIEGICKRNSQGYFISAEGSSNTQGKLYHLQLPAIISSLSISPSSNTFSIFPNPAKTEIHIKADRIQFIQLFTLQGTCVASSATSTLELPALPSGAYSVVIHTENDKILMETLIIE